MREISDVIVRSRRQLFTDAASVIGLFVLLHAALTVVSPA